MNINAQKIQTTKGVEQTIEENKDSNNHNEKLK